MEKLLKPRVKCVICAASPEEALILFQNKKNENIFKLDLVISDVVMPKMNGKQLEERIDEFIPNLPFLFISGYSANVISHNRIMNEEINFLQKPFSTFELLDAVAAFF